jgi:hypothetical protein
MKNRNQLEEAMIKSYLEHSFLFKTIRIVLLAYKESLLKKIAVTLGIWYKHSAYHRGVVRYLEKRSTAEDTLAYGLLSRFGTKFDKVAAGAHAFFERYTKSSACFQLMEGLLTEIKYSFNKLFIIALTAFVVGYALVAGVQRTVSIKTLLGLVCIGIVVVAFNRWKCTLKKWLESSVLYRIFNYTIE